jgi:hypothetical protein
MATTIAVTPTALEESARKYRQELLIMAILGLDKSIQHMSLRTGIRFEEVVGQLSGAAELAPYTGAAPTASTFAIAGRTLATFLGSCVKLVDPNSLVSSLYGSGIASGKGLETVDINKSILAFMMGKISKGLNQHLFDAVRDANGDETVDLFNGFDTIAAAAISGGTIADGHGNYYEITSEITSSNAVDVLKAVFRAASDELQSEMTKMFIPFSVYNAYVDDYQASVGAVPYNTQFNKTFLEGSNNMCELVPLVGKAGSDLITLTTKQNMLVGTYLMGDMENIEVRRGDNPFALQFITTMFFGTQFESISEEVLMIGEVTAT